jgi:hypothetical protein
MGDDRDDVEVGPPERRHRRDPEQGGEHLPAVELEVHLGSGGEHRFAERDHHDQAVALGEVAGVEPELAAPEEQRGRPVDQDRQNPDGRARTAVQGSRHDQQRGPEQEPGSELQDRLQVVRVALAPGAPDVEDQLHRPDEEVGAAEQQPTVAERLRDAQ